MIDRLTERLDARFTFVVGKGGVGKSTASGALALRWADAGRSVHLLSTDPAHSLGDLFGQTLRGRGPVRSVCHERLLLEELDAPARARSWLDQVREPVCELVDLGTYLDGDEVRAFVDGSLPGVDEVMAAQRLVELERAQESERIVVDTAPTGHLLRMLDAGAVLEGWSGALAAMAAKAGAVAAGLTRRRPRFAGEEVMERMRDDVDALVADVLKRADFVLVTRTDAVVGAEAGRLERALASRGCSVRARLVVGGSHRGDAAVPTFGVPRMRDARGCTGLRSWPGAGARADPDDPDRRDRAGQTAVLELLRGRELYLFVGKGGVGKTTCAAAFALALQDEHDVLLLGVDPAGSLGDVMGRPVAHAETRCAPSLWARELDPDGELTEFRRRYRERIRAVFERLGLRDTVALDRHVLESILEMAPSGVDEIFALDAILEETSGRRVLVVDTAPTGHLMRLLEMPELARSWTRALVRLLLRHRAILGIDDFAGQLLAFARRLEALIQMLADPGRVGTIVVTIDEPLPRLETDRLLAALRRSRTPVAAVLHNRRGAASRAASGRSTKVPRISAPLVEPPPVGSERLLDFFGGWSPA